EEIGANESTTFVLPQELSSLVGRYGKHLTDSDVAEPVEGLESLDFDAETRELLGLDDIDEILQEIGDSVEVEMTDMEEEAQAVSEGATAPDIKSAEEVIEEMDAELEGEEEPE
ncbi:MAG: phosphoesterase, partial [Halodesulfurarchaeum sp.]